MRGNCHGTSALQTGDSIYVPSSFSPAPTPLPTICGAPSDWVSYTVQSGDTLFSIARRYNVDMRAIQRANCMPSHFINAGDILYVPTEASVLLPKDYPAPVIISPEDGANFPPGVQVELQWTWDGELSEHEHFDVRLWKRGAPNYGVGWSKEEHYAVKGDPGVTYYWSVAVIYGKDGNMEKQLSPETPPREITWGDPE
jgi:LysM repeat protein